MQLILLLLRSNARRLVLALLVSIVSGASSAGLIALVHHVWQEQAFTSTFWLLSFVGVLTVMIVSNLAAQLMVLDLSLNVVADMRMELSSRILATPLRRTEELGSARLMAVLTDDVNHVSAVLPNIPRMVIDLTTMLAGGLYMAWLSISAFAITAGFLLVGITAYRLLWGRAVAYLWRARATYDDLFRNFHALHDGIKQLKLNRRRRHSYLSDDLHGSLETYRGLQMSGRSLMIGAESITRLMFFGVMAVLIFAIPRMQGVALEVLSGYILMALYLYRPLGLLLQLVPEFGRGRVALQKIDELGLALSHDASATRGEVEAVPAPGWQRLELTGVTYRYRREYDDNVFTMGPIDLNFEPGEVVFVVGGNGSGKTTFAKTLTSLYPVDEGEIRLDGELIGPENVERYRELFSAVFSDYYLFRDLLGTTDSDLDAQANRYLEELQLDHKVKVDAGRLSTTDLSQGQRKRLALLSAYLEDRPFYVFDEWAADQDPQFKRIFYTEVLPELKSRGKTVLVITHDERYLHLADRCLKLEDGKLRNEDAVAPVGDAARLENRVGG